MPRKKSCPLPIDSGDIVRVLMSVPGKPFDNLVACPLTREGVAKNEISCVGCHTQITPSMVPIKIKQKCSICKSKIVSIVRTHLVEEKA